MGTQVLLNWTFSYDASSPSWRKWYKATESGTQIGRTIVTKCQSYPVEISRPEYEGRMEIVANGAILLKNVSISDEGYMRFGVDFTNGVLLQHQIMLNVTSKDLFICLCIYLSINISIPRLFYPIASCSKIQLLLHLQYCISGHILCVMHVK